MGLLNKNLIFVNYSLWIKSYFYKENFIGNLNFFRNSRYTFHGANFYGKFADNLELSFPTNWKLNLFRNFSRHSLLIDNHREISNWDSTENPGEFAVNFQRNILWEFTANRELNFHRKFFGHCKICFYWKCSLLGAKSLKGCHHSIRNSPPIWSLDSIESLGNFQSLRSLLSQGEFPSNGEPTLHGKFGSIRQFILYIH